MKHGLNKIMINRYTFLIKNKSGINTNFVPEINELSTNKRCCVFGKYSV
jgi:hypothetical protein